MYSCVSAYKNSKEIFLLVFNDFQTEENIKLYLNDITIYILFWELKIVFSEHKNKLCYDYVYYLTEGHLCMYELKRDLAE